ncbi:hypothetical protein LTS18_003395 [Coniosporium uncinatum]|uniref:Uncharacterized protein n=1 Tax=Coniosporium uncinatum TaxID=93489 RepID=A0ACC3DYP8_9PEZI|nr:hypothetical protein LTS18_003395 [Coniosporium uncinatum]
MNRYGITDAGFLFVRGTGLDNIPFGKHDSSRPTKAILIDAMYFRRLAISAEHLENISIIGSQISDIVILCKTFRALLIKGTKIRSIHIIATEKCVVNSAFFCKSDLSGVVVKADIFKEIEAIGFYIEPRIEGRVVAMPKTTGSLIHFDIPVGLQSPGQGIEETEDDMESNDFESNQDPVEAVRQSFSVRPRALSTVLEEADVAATGNSADLKVETDGGDLTGTSILCNLDALSINEEASPTSTRKLIPNSVGNALPDTAQERTKKKRW